uniref:Uncharacterized protein n=1 Tax=viral metagenome TaxID=1070528 RepID=A0A6M3XQZ5_9ZZZZ
MTKIQALQSLANAEGYNSAIDLLEDLMADVDLLSNGVCLNCGTHGKVELDSDCGWCYECHENKVTHAFILAGII